MSNLNTSREQLFYSGHMIFMAWYIDTRAGGPSGYLGNLRAGMDRVDSLYNEKIHLNCLSRKPAVGHSEKTEETLRNMLSWVSNIDAFHIPDRLAQKFDDYEPTSVHAHICHEMISVMNHYDVRGKKRPLTIFTSHTPESWGLETANTWRQAGFAGQLADDFERAARALEAKAFRESDVWILPSQEAIEPYLATIPSFEHWMKSKDIRFMRSGVMGPKTHLVAEEAKEKFDLSGRKVVAFIGRHLAVKGYDLFIDAAISLLEEFDDLHILVAGKLDGIDPPVHPRWTELGWYQAPQEVICASDIFVLPNRMTYYDLVLLEAMSLGATIVATETGGNKTMGIDSPGALELCSPNAEGLGQVIRELLKDPDRRARLSETARREFEEKYNEVSFARRYVDLIRKIRADHSIG